MIDLTVKTLDSQNHAFSLEDDQITVRGFKEHIAESVAVPADSQRLIYCGRVLQDEKKLNDYDVNGKVIHLVQRAPPQPGQRNNDSPQNQRQGQGMIWRSWQNVRPQMQGNTMYLGAMSVPAEVMMDGTGLTGMQVPQYSNTLATNRLNIARQMLNRINELLDRLDDPSLPLHPPASEQHNSPPVAAQVHIQEIETESDDNEGGFTNSARFAQAASTAIAAALSAAGLSNVTLLQGSADESGNITTIGTAQAESTSEPQSQSQQQQQQPQGESQDSASNSFDRQPNRRPTLQLPRPAQMADLLEKLTSTQNRLQPYIDRFRELMQADPTLPLSNGTEGVESNQKLVDGVSESLHFMSHALHALSDINVDMAQQAPRNLRCRSQLIQQSTILQAGIPIQVEAHISLNGRHANNNNSNEESNDSATAQQSTDTAESGTASSEESSQQQESDNGADPQTQPTQQAQPEANATPFGTLFNLPNNVEVLMEMSPESSRRDTLRGVTGESASRSEENQTSENNNNTTRGGVMGQIDPEIIFSSWSAPPAEVFRSVMQAATGQMLQANIASNMMAASLNPGATGQQSVSFSLDSANTNPGQSTQARSNVGTHPTTATQTRSTSRPHIFHQQTPLSVGMAMGQGGSMNFDPFLPCNSHHIRRNPPVTPNASSTPQRTRAGPSGSATQETPAQAQSSSSASTEETNASSTSTTSQSSAQADPTINFLLNFLRRMSSSNGGQSQASVNISTSDEDSGSRNNANLLAEILGQGSSNSANTRGLTLLDLLGRRRMFFSPNEEPGQNENLFTDLLIVFAQNMTLEGLVSLKFGEYEPIANLRKPFREFLQRAFSSAPTPEALQEQVLERLVTQLRPHLQHLLAPEEDNSGKSGFRVDLCATIESIFSRHTKELLHLLFHDKVLDPHFARQTMSIFRTIGSQLCAVLRYSLRGGQDGLETVAVRFLHEMVGDIEPGPNSMLLCGYMVELPFSYFRTYSRRISQPPEEDIIPLLVYKNISSQSTPAAAATTTTTATTTVHQSLHSQPPVEPMEVETVEEKPNNDQALGDEDEEIPETFPGHEALPSDWVPIIARDGVRQRRQLQMQGMVNGGVTTFSDAYLGGLPSKRRKLIEQQKPHLLVSSSSNHSAITSSVERLVRDSVNRAGVEEVEGSVVAVAADSGVRRAFGQAIRDCLNPNRYGTPDFPDSLRFPNATKYFADKEKPSK